MLESIGCPAVSAVALRGGEAGYTGLRDCVAERVQVMV